MSPASETPFTVTVATNPAPSGDFKVTPNRTLSFAADATSSTGTVTITAVNNNVDAADRTVTVSGTASINTVTAPSDLTLTIPDDDVPAFTIEDASGSEGGMVVFRVRMSVASTKAMTVSYATSDIAGQAAAGTDYTARNGTLTFAIGETLQTISVMTTDDTVDDPVETFTMTLSSPSSDATGDAAVQTTASATGTISEGATLSIANASIVEGSKMRFTVTLSEAPTGSDRVTVRYATSTEADDTAEMTDDYNRTSGTLGFFSGQTETSFLVRTVNDGVDEEDETFTVTLSSPSAGVTIITATATGTITDDDEVPGAPANLAAEAGDAQVVLTCAAPDSAGTSTITGYEYSYAPSGEAFSAWASVGMALTATVTGLTNGDAHEFLVRAVSAAGAGPAATQAATPQEAVRTNNAPVFADATATRSVAENTAANTNIPYPVTAADADGDTLTYTLEGTDAASFDIVGTSGQIQTKAALDYEAKSSYSVRVRASDGTDSDTIAVTINVTNVNEAGTVSLSPALPRVGTALTATLSDPDGGVTGKTWAWASSTDKSAWTAISGADSASYTPVDGDLNRYLRATASYADTLGAGRSAAGISANKVAAQGTNSAPVFADATATRSVAENTAADTNISYPVMATDADGDTLTYTLEGTDAASFAIVSTNGRLRTKAALDYETKSSYSVTVKASDGTDSDTIAVTINVTNVNEAGTVSLSPALPRVGTALTATLSDPDGGVTGKTWAWASSTDKSAWTAISGADSASYTPVDGDLNRYLRATASYADTLGAGRSAAGISANKVAAQGTNSAPVFADATATRSVAENTAADTNISYPVMATDADGDTLTYTLEGTDAASFAIVSTNGRLRTKAALDYETKSSYSVTVKASDGTDSDTIAVTINVTNVNEAGTVSLSPALPRVGTALTATLSDPDGGVTGKTWAWASSTDKSAWTAISGADSASYTPVDGDLNRYLRATASYADTLGAGRSAAGISANKVAAQGTNSAPVFADATATRSVAENTAADTNISYPVMATDADGDTLTYTLEGTDAASFAIVSTNGRLRTKAALDYETKSSYSVTVKASDGTDSDTIAVTINVTNVNEAGTVSLSPALPRVGTALTATLSDPDGGVTGKTWAWASSTDKSAWTAISGADSASYTPVDGDLNRYLRATASYADTLGAGRSAAGISANKVAAQGTNSAPVFADATATRSVAENTAADTNISYPVMATDADGDTLTYTLEGTDAASFAIVSTNGRLRTKAALDYETKSSYSVTVKASDGTASDTIAVSIRVIDVAEGGPVDAGHHSAPGGTIWSAKLTSRYLVVDGEYLRVYGYQKEGSDGNEDQGALSDVDFVIGSDTYTVKGIRQWMETSRGYENDWLTVVLSRELTPADLSALTLHVSGVSFAFSKATDAPAADGGGTVYGWKVDWDGPLNWRTGSSLRFHSGVVHDVHITSSAAGTNARATGRPVITGTARIGETLEVDTSGIADANGLSNAAFKYQWTVIEADGAAGDRMSGATVRLSSWIKYRYGHLGKKLQVRVFFTDDAGNVESLLSETTATIVDQDEE